jgi:hypothetical protein
VKQSVRTGSLTQNDQENRLLAPQFAGLCRLLLTAGIGHRNDDLAMALLVSD